MAQQPIEVQGQPTDCWPHAQLTADRGERPSGQFRGDVGQYVAFSTFFDFLDRDHRYKSLHIQISHDVPLAAFPHTGQKFLPHWELNPHRIL